MSINVTSTLKFNKNGLFGGSLLIWLEWQMRLWIYVSTFDLYKTLHDNQLKEYGQTSPIWDNFQFGFKQ